MLVPTIEGLDGRVSTGLAVEIGGVCLALEAASADVCLELSRSLRPFACDAGAADVVLRVSRGDLGGRRRAGRRLFRSIVSGFRKTPGWELWERGDERVFWLSSPLLGRAPSEMARFDPRFRRGELVVHERYFPAHLPLDPLPHPLDELIVMHWLAQGRGLALRASGIIDGDGRGYLFAGPAGSGKTTIARLWLAHAAGLLVSDERVVVRRQGGHFWMYGTPWHGRPELAAPHRAPVTAIFALDRGGGEVAAVPLAPAQSAAVLAAGALVPSYLPGAREQTRQLALEMAQALPCARLAFRRDRSFLEVVRAAAG